MLTLLLFAILCFVKVKISMAMVCEPLPSSVFIIKDVCNPSGILERTCEGEIAVSKCEGSCPSKVRPSALTSTGFYQVLQCCREINRTRSVTLNKCYDPDGKVLMGDNEKYIIAVIDHVDCNCYSCEAVPNLSLESTVKYPGNNCTAFKTSPIELDKVPSTAARTHRSKIVVPSHLFALITLVVVTFLHKTIIISS